MARKIKRDQVTEVPTGADELTLPRWFPRKAQNHATGALVDTDEIIVFCPRRGDPAKKGEGRDSCGKMARIRKDAVEGDGTYRNFACVNPGCDFLGDLQLLGWPEAATVKAG